MGPAIISLRSEWQSKRPRRNREVHHLSSRPDELAPDATPANAACQRGALLPISQWDRSSQHCCWQGLIGSGSNSQMANGMANGGCGCSRDSRDPYYSCSTGSRSLIQFAHLVPTWGTALIKGGSAGGWQPGRRHDEGYPPSPLPPDTMPARHDLTAASPLGIRLAFMTAGLGLHRDKNHGRVCLAPGCSQLPKSATRKCDECRVPN